MAYNDYTFGSGYPTTYSGNYYGYQVGVIFAILIAGVLLLAICAAIIYFGCVKGMRRGETQRRASFSKPPTRPSVARVYQPTSTYTQFIEKTPLPYEQPRSGYSPDQETPILQSSMHTQAAYMPPPPTYAGQPAYLQQKQPLEKTFSRPQVLEDTQPRQVTIAERSYDISQPTRIYSRQDESSTWRETSATRSTAPEQQRIVTIPISFHTSSV